MSRYAYLSIRTPELAAELAKLPAPIDPVDPAASRAAHKATIAPNNEKREKYMDMPPEIDYKIGDHEIPVRGGDSIRVRTIVPIPKGISHSPFPLFIWFHGGGWIMGAPEMDDLPLIQMSVELNVSIVNVDYRLSPEHPFPIPANDCYDAIKWAATNASELSASPSKGLMIGGCSSGANIAAALAIRARDDPFFNTTPGIKLTGQLIQSPCLVHRTGRTKFNLLPYEELDNDVPTLSLNQVYLATEYYNPDPTDPLFSPLHASSHKNLAPAYFQIYGFDPLRDEGLLYEQILKKSGVLTKLETYAGYPHAGDHVLAGLEITKKFERDFVGGVRWLIQNGATPDN
ncbi:alpha/beta-hydrolase [Abortiporus biennis]|nr:alpha/beta-hydrolase [Abortiporus biennis]